MSDGRVEIEVEVNGKGVTVLNKNLDQLEGKSNKAGASIKNLVVSLGLVKVASAGLNVLKNSLDAAISRFDTMQKFPKVMKALGFSAEDSQKSINKLSDGIDGLPTKLDDVVSSTQQMTAITGDLDKSTDTVLALNNAFLASGASTEDASRGMQQYNQMLSTGQVDLESWKTLQETMPLALQKTAEAMGFVGKSAQRDLYNALKEGRVTFDQFQDKLIELGTGTGMLASLARENSLGISTSFGNLANAVSKGVANVITKFDELVQRLSGKTIAQNIDGMKAIINNSFNSIVQSMEFLISHTEELKAIASITAPIVAALTGALISLGVASIVSTAISGLTTALITLKNLGLIGTIKMLVGFMSPINWLIAAIGALISVFIYFYKTNENFRNSINGTIKTIKSGLIKSFELLKNVMASILPTLEKIVSVISALATGVFQKLVAVGGAIISVIAPAFESLSSAIKQVISSGIERLSEIFSKVVSILSGSFSKGIQVAGNLLEKLGGEFGKLGGVISIVVSVLLKVAIAALGLTGPLGLAVSLVISFMAAWAKTGDFSADGITKVFDQLSETISNVANSISRYLPKIIESITSVITSIINKIVEMLPQFTEAAIQIIQTLTNAIVTYLPKLIEIATKIVTTIVQGISSALPEILSVAAGIITKLISAFAEFLPKLIEVGTNLLTTLIQGIVTALPTIVEVVIQIVNTLIDGFLTALPMLLEVGLQIITSLVNAIITALPQLVEAAITIVTTLLTTIIESLPTLISTGIQMLMALIEGIISIIPLLINAAIQIITALISALISALPQIIEAGIQLLLALIKGMISILPQLVAAAIQITIALVKALISALPQLIDAGIQLISALVKGVISVLPQLVSAAVKLISALFKALISAIPQLLSAGVQLIQALIRGTMSLLGQVISSAARLIQGALNSIKSFFGKMLDAGVTLIKNLVNGIKNMVGSVVSSVSEIGSSIMDKLRGINLFSIGKNIIQGLINGIGSMVGAVASKISEVAGNITGKIKGALGIHSPSRVMKNEVGKFIPQGIAVGIEDDAKIVYSAMSNLYKGLMKPIQPETALATGRIGLAHSGNQIINNTYHQNEGIDLKALARVLNARPLNVQAVVDPNQVNRRLTPYNAATVAERTIFAERGMVNDARWQ
ncbi:tape measure protein [Enterococcus hirae]|uniref:tape measure protein n=1 Tax=Enterococcus hirae TaxID=1354 RepID=UPI002DB69243|nr:tape measure protein [Enterococcus hirae]MEB7518679.1 tape measure protein [Enterococcus hirae]